ncbi:MAG: hypothetical protein EBR09_02755 [Proteobacteria bacterium]|nr:hypothetical protein [Pseudomonadota bacterium]
MSRLLLGYSCLVIGISAVSCSKSSSGGSTPGTGALTTTGSCNMSDQNFCFELYTAAIIEQYRTTCAQTQGTFSATTGCKTEGRRKGCQSNLQNVKTYTQWSYDETSEDTVEAVCVQMNSQAQGVTFTVVNP